MDGGPVSEISLSLPGLPALLGGGEFGFEAVEGDAGGGRGDGAGWGDCAWNSSVAERLLAGGGCGSGGFRL